jgi:hypothetical protein
MMAEFEPSAPSAPSTPSTEFPDFSPAAPTCETKVMYASLALSDASGGKLSASGGFCFSESIGDTEQTKVQANLHNLSSLLRVVWNDAQFRLRITLKQLELQFENDIKLYTSFNYGGMPSCKVKHWETELCSWMDLKYVTYSSRNRSSVGTYIDLIRTNILNRLPNDSERNKESYILIPCTIYLEKKHDALQKQHDTPKGQHGTLRLCLGAPCMAETTARSGAYSTTGPYSCTIL